MHRITNLQPHWKLLTSELLLCPIECRPLQDELHIIGVFAPLDEDLEYKDTPIIKAEFVFRSSGL
jgi:hypothetical protein